MTKVYRTDKNKSKITTLEALAILPRYIIFKHSWGKRRERRETFFHRYHLSFQAAKTYLAAEWRVEIKRSEERLKYLNDELRKTNNLKET